MNCFKVQYYSGNNLNCLFNPLITSPLTEFLFLILRELEECPALSFPARLARSREIARHILQHKEGLLCATLKTFGRLQGYKEPERLEEVTVPRKPHGQGTKSQKVQMETSLTQINQPETRSHVRTRKDKK